MSVSAVGCSEHVFFRFQSCRSCQSKGVFHAFRGDFPSRCRKRRKTVPECVYACVHQSKVKVGVAAVVRGANQSEFDGSIKFFTQGVLRFKRYQFVKIVNFHTFFQKLLYFAVDKRFQLV